MEKLAKPVQKYLMLINVFAIGSLFVFGLLFMNSFDQIDLKIVILFSILFALTESFPIFYKNLCFSSSFAIQLCVFLTEGPLVTLAIVLIGFSFRVMRFNGKFEHLFNLPYFKSLFNYSLYIITIATSSVLYVAAGGNLASPLIEQVFPLFVYCLVSALVTFLLISRLNALLSESTFKESFYYTLKIGLPNLLIMSPIGIIGVIILQKFHLSGLLIYGIPIVFARYMLAQNFMIVEKYEDTINIILNALEARDEYTRGHAKRVADIATSIARQMSLTPSRIEAIKTAAQMHDIGKIGVNDFILRKHEKLTLSEHEHIQQHPLIGYNILKDIRQMNNVLDIVLYHHERYDGKGYPEGKKGSELSIEVYIIQLSDAVDAMSTDRPYRVALSKNEIIKEIINGSATQFHPDVVNAYLELIRINDIQAFTVHQQVS